jgi:DNA-binding MarR family transcriptional regulator
MPTDKLTPATCPAVYATVCAAAENGLSFAQMAALQWLSWHLTAGRMAWRAAGITGRTLQSLEGRGLIAWRERAGRPDTYYYSLTEAGRAALAQSGHTGDVK